MSCAHNLPCEGRFLWYSADYGLFRSDDFIAQVGDPVGKIWDRAGYFPLVQGTTARQMRRNETGGIIGDGTDDQYNLHFQPAASFRAFTICLAVAEDHRTNPKPSRIFDSRFVDGYGYIAIYRASNARNFIYFRDTNLKTALIGSARTPRNWIVVRWGGGKIEGFNSNSQGEGEIITTTLSRIEFSSIVLGGYHNFQPGQCFDQAIYELIMYDRALNDQEIQMFGRIHVA